MAQNLPGHREELKGYAVGAWGNLCKAGLPSRRQNAAHYQITERKASIARLLFSPGAEPYLLPNDSVGGLHGWGKQIPGSALIRSNSRRGRVNSLKWLIGLLKGLIWPIWVFDGQYICAD